MACSNCNGLGYPSSMFIDDGVEDTFNGLSPVYAKVPATEERPQNSTADMVVAALNAKAPTGGPGAVVPGAVDISEKVAVGTALPANGGPGAPIFFTDEDAPYRPAVTAPAAEEPAPKSKAVKYGIIGLGLYAAWKLIGG